MPDWEDDVIDTLTSALGSVSNELLRYAQSLADYSQDAADKLERGFDSYAESLRTTMTDNDWVPKSIKPSAPRPPPPPKFQLGLLGKCSNWINENRAITAAIVGFAGTSVFLLYRYRASKRRYRRARRASNGAKTEVVILAGSPYAQTTKSIAGDLEKRGFLIYIPVSSLDEEAAVSELRSSNIHPLNFDVTSDESTSEMVEKLTNILKFPNRHGTSRLHLASLVIVESYNTSLAPGPIRSLHSSSWSDALVSKVLYPVSLIQIFLPLLLTESTIPENEESTTIVIVTPSNISAINAPDHAQESATTAALTSYISTLRLELPDSLHLTHIRLGSLAQQSTASNRLEMAMARIRKFAPTSPSSSKSASPSQNQIKKEASDSFTHTSEMRKLHHGVFDAVVGRTEGTVFLGRGARLYAVIGAIAPHSFVAWMVHRRARDPIVAQSLEPAKMSSSSSWSTGWENIREA